MDTGGERVACICFQQRRDEGDIGLENQKANVASSLQFPVIRKWVRFPVQVGVACTGEFDKENFC
jgi:hypothetical protein